MIGSTIEKEVTPLLTLAVGLNQVDKIVIDGWNDRLNLPTKEAEKQIERRADDIVAKLSVSFTYRILFSTKAVSLGKSAEQGHYVYPSRI